MNNSDILIETIKLLVGLQDVFFETMMTLRITFDLVSQRLNNQEEELYQLEIVVQELLRRVKEMEERNDNR